MEHDRRDDLLAWLGFLFAVLLAVCFVCWCSAGAPLKAPEGITYFQWGNRHFAAGTWTTEPLHPERDSRIP